jgi:type III pantothenate kinase
LAQVKRIAQPSGDGNQSDQVGELAIANLGNTNLRLVRFSGDAIVQDQRVGTREAIAQLPSLPAGCPIVLVSVVPPVAEGLLEAWRDHPLLVVNAETAGLAIAYTPPTALGADRLANAAALRARWGGGIAVDCGTATTLTVVDAEGVVRGGSIMPGLGTARASLFTGTAQLPEVPLEVPEGPWGTSTVGSIQTGLVHGHVGAIGHLVERMRDALGPETPVVLTGGWSRLLKPVLPGNYEWVPDLTIQGAREIWGRHISHDGGG